jgi:hypothetical protein
MTAIAEFARNTRSAFEVLERSGHLLQALIVLYSAIDTLAWASKKTGDVTPRDFCRWVADYMRPVENIGCTPRDLYGARCALLHSSGAESRLSRRGRAAPIWCVTQKTTLPKVQKILRKTGAPAKLVCTEDLLALFSLAATLFRRTVSKDPVLKARVAKRIGGWFGRLPAAPTLEAWKAEL